MPQIIDLVKALASLAWPVFAFVVLFKFEPEIKAVLGRLRRGKVLGQEIELEESLQRLDASARAAESATPALVAASDAAAASQDADPAQRVLHEAARSPKVALMLLSSLLEREAFELLASMGSTPKENVRSLRQLLGSLQHSLPRNVAGAVDHFSDVRNKIVHGRTSTDSDILRALDSGLTILRTVRAIPHETNTVYAAGVELYTDAAGQRARANVKGIVLQTTSPGGAQKHLRVFPTTRTHFQKGKRVAWEWSSDVVVDESWYRHPDTGKVEYAWTQSMEFVGRHLDDL